MQPTNTPYYSNPFKMISPSATALGVNIGTLVKLLVLQLAPLIPLAIAAIILYVDSSNPIMLSIGILLGAIAIIAMLVIGLWSIPAYNMILVASADGAKVGLKESFTKARPFIGRSLGVVILTALAFLGGLMLFIVPGFIFLAWFSLSLFVVVTENLGVTASMKRSKELVKGRIWEIWALNAIPTLGSFVPLIGSLLNLVLSVILAPVLAIRYRQLSTTAADKRPGIHWVNYALIIVPIISAVFAFFALIAFANSYEDNSPSSQIYYNFE